MGSVVGGIVGAAGNYFGGKRAADAARDAGVRQMQAGERAFQASRFRPVGITTRFGTSAFETDPYGRVTSATYEASPEIQRLQQQISGLYGGPSSSLAQAARAAELQPQFEQGAAGLLSLGRQYLGESPAEMRKQYMEDQLAALRPYDIEEEERLAASNLARGTGGLSVGRGGNPMYKALLEARNRRNLQIAAGADPAVQQRIGFGAGLFGQAANTLGSGYGTQTAALQPFQTQFSTVQGLEQAAQQPLEMGLNIGEAASLAGARAGELYSDAMNRANTSFRQQGNIRGGMLAGLGRAGGNILGGMELPTGGGGTMPGIMGRTASGMPYQYGARNAPGSWGQPF